MTLHDTLTAALYRAIDELNAQLPAARRLEHSPDTVLFGREEGLDSLSLVNLVVAVEREVEKQFGRAVPLSDPEVMLAPETPFATVRSLATYLASRLEID